MVAYTVASAYAQQYPDEAFTWAISLPNAESRMAAQAVVTIIAQSGSDYAGQLVKRITDPKIRKGAAQSVMSYWAQTDPQAVGVWIAGFEGTEQRTPLYRGLLQQRSQYDRDAAVGLLDRIPERNERDAAIVVLLSSFNDDLPRAESLYNRIRAGDQRHNAAQQLYHMPRNADPAGAERYRVMADLPDSG